jgi:hypothetical protein
MKTTKQQSQWLTAFSKRCERIQSSSFSSFHSHSATPAQRIERATKDYAFFCSTYFPHLCSTPCAPFHIAAANSIKASPHFRGLFQWARGMAKSTHISLIIPLWLALCHKQKLCLVLVSKSEEMADRLLGDLQAEVSSNSALKEDFSSVLSVSSLSCGELSLSSGCVFYSLGRGQSPRGLKKQGLRPNYIVIDDIDDDELCRSPRRVSEAISWVSEALFGTMQIGRGRFILVGNLISKTSVLAHFEENKNFTLSKVNILTSQGEPSWPQNHTLSEILSLRSDQGERAFQKEYMNNPITEGSVFHSENIIFSDMLPLSQYRQLICYTDPSFKSTATSDYKATLLCGKTPKGHFHVLKAFCAQCSITQMIAWHYTIASYIGDSVPVLFYIESNFLQGLILDAFRSEGDRRAEHIAIRGDSRHKPDKFARIEALEPLFAQNLIIFNKKEKDTPGFATLRDQLLSFSRGSRCHDDAPDALEGAIWLLRRRWTTSTNLTQAVPPFRSRKF